ncbi:uncharacterized protein CANTADRAFT_24910 [Suhomyces tanzawaensis NRRL Y-17324]|uniref:Uncharacterized protein n=1 Tax=Suhomyces tanzawaensis NRRL Y-17324 TaxID=984487 RepID=A0A1E4SS78_9ASCO|nr:uncharacterized protein CANTADRAFT_24910 [Suhomyces tanzawaensis NRRL Y-17324]ODV82370.1 hypothetical protein CANTADRAFT_24910 [Suhomyces tanzawaensis NRRL Y-17324]
MSSLASFTELFVTVLSEVLWAVWDIFCVYVFRVLPDIPVSRHDLIQIWVLDIYRLRFEI